MKTATRQVFLDEVQMAATGILYVDVVAVVIGEVLGAWLSALVHLPYETMARLVRHLI